MNRKIIPDNALELLKSKWGEIAQDPKKRASILKQLAKLFAFLGKKHPVALRIQLALLLIAGGQGKELLSVRNILIVFAALAYCVSPFDFIPDFMPVVGWFDDIGVFDIALAMILNQIDPEKYKNIENKNSQISDDEIVEIMAELPAPAENDDSLQGLISQINELPTDTQSSPQNLAPPIAHT